MQWLTVGTTLLSVWLVGGIHHYPPVGCGARDAGDAGDPLFLTPYVERGDLVEGRRRARVPFTDDLNITSYAGYFTVNKTYDSNHFFWYFPPINATLDAPVVLWLQGGPGATSLYGLFVENGPITVCDNKFMYRSDNWALNHHLIYIDSPVGTGFSFTKNESGYCVDEDQVGDQLHSTVTQFLKLFPDIQQNKFFVSGESYGGKYVPALGHAIHKKNPTAEVKINLKGLAIGNGLSDPGNQMAYSKYLYQIGLIDWNQVKVFEQYEKKATDYIEQKKWNEAFETVEVLINGDLNKGDTIFHNYTGFNFYYNYLHTNDYTPDDFGPMIQKTFVRKGIHVGEMVFHNDTKVEEYLKQDMMQSVAPWVAELLDNYKVLIYSGQLDMLVAHPLTLNYLRKLNFTGADEYKTAKRHIWRVDGDVAGYVKQAGRLVEVLVRNAGHMVPTDQPKWAFDLITRFTHNKQFLDT